MIITAAGGCLVLLGAVHAALKTLRLDDIDISAAAAGPTSAPNLTLTQPVVRATSLDEAVPPAAGRGLKA